MPILTEKTLLMDIELNTSDIPTISTDITTIASDTTSLVGQVGEVQINPSQYSLLDRLKTISLSGNSSKFAKISSTLIRPNNTTAYGANNVINTSTTSITLPSFDFTGHDGELFLMQSITMIVGDSSSSSLLPIRVMFFDSETLTGQDIGDNQDLTIPLTEILSHMLCLGALSSANLQKISTLCYVDQYQAKQFIIPVGGIVYYCLASQGAFTPTANESITFQLIGTFITPL